MKNINKGCKSLRYSGIFNDISCDTVTEESDDLKVPESAVTQDQEQDTLDKTKADNTNQDASVSVKTQVNIPLERSPNETGSVKKRFSFFSLYSYNTSKSSLYSSIDSKRKPSPPSQRRPKKDDSHTNSRTSSTTASNVSTSHKSKNDQSVQTIAQDERIPEPKKAFRSERASIMVSEITMANTDRKEIQYPEQSTAKRVLGFFKRRSMRV